MVCDANDDRLCAIRERFPLISTTTDCEELRSNRWVDVVVAATPAATHFPIAQQALRLGKHVLVEKPLTTSMAEAEAA